MSNERKTGYIAVSKLVRSESNMRYAKKLPDVSDILPSIREKGVFQSLLIRAQSKGIYEVVAGNRRFTALSIVANETGEEQYAPYIELEKGDDAAAIEASLIENVLRRDAHEMQQYATYARLIAEGRSVAEIAATFGLKQREVEQRLALGNLLPQIRDLYTDEQIDPETAQALTLASKAQQKEWLALFKTDKAPDGGDVRHWLCGGDAISTKAALFPEAEYKGVILGDLFGDQRFFADAEQFWALQNTAIADRRDKLIEKGWAAVEIIERGQHWEAWKYEKATKKAGGKVFILVNRDGSVSFHEGYLTRAELARKAKKDAHPSGEREVCGSSRPEVTQSQNNYIEAHRQAGIRAALVQNPATAFRLLIAHCLASAGNIKVAEDRLDRHGKDVAASVAAMAPHQQFEAARHAAADVLGFAGDGSNSLTGRYFSTGDVFQTLLGLTDSQVMQVAAVVMAEALDAGSKAGEAAGRELKVDLGSTWVVDQVFFEQLRDKEVLGAMLAEVAGKDVADANLTATGKVKKQIIHDCIAGTNGREARAWLPKWLQPEIGIYTDRGGIRLAMSDRTAEGGQDDELADHEGSEDQD